jgi:excisionase family DNA binding protein
MMADTIRLLTLEETAAALRLSPHTIRAFVRKGRLSPVRICRRLLFRVADVEKLITASCSTEQL